MSGNQEAFNAIVQGQMDIPSLAEREKQALDDLRVQEIFETVSSKASVEYLYFLNFLTDRYFLSLEEAEGIYNRLSYRRMLTNGR